MSLTSPDLLRRLTEAGVLDPAAARAALEGLEQPTAEQLAARLRERGLVTDFQLEASRAEPPRRLAYGEYVLLRPLGSGGMGEVYEARHRRMDRLVALKVLPRAFTNSPDAVQRFHREVKAIARLQHPNVAMAFDASEAGGEHYLVMERVPGRDLESLVRAEGPLPVGRALELLRQAAEGLAYAHENGIVHRDVKPANFLVTEEGVVKLLDLGIARLRDDEPAADEPSLTRTGFLLGTIAYMAPEHAENPRNADERSDIYSLGCTLYRILTGRFPYRGESVIQVLLAAREEPTPDLRDHLEGGPECSDFLDGLQSVFARMVAKRPEERQASMGAVVEAISALLASATPAARALHAASPASPPTPAGVGAAAVGETETEATRIDPRRSAAGDDDDEATVLEGSRARPVVRRRRAADPGAEPADDLPASARATRPGPPARARPSSPVPPASPRSRRRPWLLLAAVAAATVALGAWWTFGLSGESGEGRVEKPVTAPSRSTSEPPALADEAHAADEARTTEEAPAATGARSAAPTGGPGEPRAPVEDPLARALAGLRRSPLGEWSRDGEALVGGEDSAASLALAFSAAPAYEARISLSVSGDPHPARADESEDPLLGEAHEGLRLVSELHDGRVVVLDLDRPAGRGGLQTRLGVAPSTDRPPAERPSAGAEHDIRLLGSDAAHEVVLRVLPHAALVSLDGQALLACDLTRAEAGGEAPSAGGAMAGLASSRRIRLEAWSVKPLAPGDWSPDEAAGVRPTPPPPRMDRPPGPAEDGTGFRPPPRGPNGRRPPPPR